MGSARSEAHVSSWRPKADRIHRAVSVGLWAVCGVRGEQCAVRGAARVSSWRPKADRIHRAVSGERWTVGSVRGERGPRVILEAEGR